MISLYDYLHIKGLYLFAKIRPDDNTLAKEENVEFIVNFLDKTNLKHCPFWSKLERFVCSYIMVLDEVISALLLYLSLSFYSVVPL